MPFKAVLIIMLIFDYHIINGIFGILGLFNIFWDSEYF